MRQPSFFGYVVSVPLFTTHSKVPKLRLGPTAAGFSFGETEEEQIKVEVRGPMGRFEFPRVELCVCDFPGIEWVRWCTVGFEGLPGSAPPSCRWHMCRLLNYPVPSLAAL